jgi:hypothetical protein
MADSDPLLPFRPGTAVLFFIPFCLAVVLSFLMAGTANLFFFSHHGILFLLLFHLVKVLSFLSIVADSSVLSWQFVVPLLPFCHDR